MNDRRMGVRTFLYVPQFKALIPPPVPTLSELLTAVVCEEHTVKVNMMGGASVPCPTGPFPKITLPPPQLGDF